MLDRFYTCLTCLLLLLTMNAPATRSNPLELLFVSVLESAPPTFAFRKAFDAAGVATVTDVISLTKEDWKSIVWKDENNDDCCLSIVAVNTILAIQNWFLSQDSSDESVLLSLTRSSLAEFRRQRPPATASAATAPAVVPSPVRSGATVFGSASGSLSAADEFKKGIKREIGAFAKFKDRKQWNPWHRAFRATAKAQGLSNILDGTYTPSNDDETGLFSSCKPIRLLSSPTP